ncbi:GNAT family N-acetyltransferase [Campylobacter hepaticus]|uniref:N-acetyltransferase n=1 Tax=Campylobacter hepaticus TaxID=1813019 RepID=A0A6A7JTU2_9BACT|nr:N-acetyltransferase [Campylobacter hepaticus]AXP08926.1 N-acetyltransferase [Campylobacter hepaticus]MCZ0771788.1 GNAT family N-acetyltransferase [Campylobacter hepaticus]MCZ0773345.1 GNAT family N-acetyltransferase [Campylobacter hepaticus]MCZ0774467.1 GNAT family N-acetyltransferase [Campylobacter hepaticus]MCZ0774596.1 GNAT family N-acetyltransferase [Campylobacter hepaticus]
MLIRAMQKSDYQAVCELWCQIKGFGIRSIDDSKENIERFLDRNPNLSAVALMHKKIIGTILCGHDGRTGGFYHVCVHQDHRKKGVAHKMTQFCLEALKTDKINQIALIAFKNNDLGNEFWKHYGFTLREDANYYNLSLNAYNQTSFNL